MFSNKYVFHGTNEYKRISDPKTHRRSRGKGDQKEIIFEGVSFHATPHKWIAIAYTYTPAIFKINNREAYYNIGIDLYNGKEEVEIYGINSLEESLKALYRKGGYVLRFHKQDFYHSRGLGNLELITHKMIEPVSLDFIFDPISELNKRKINFKFIDLNLPGNEHYINYLYQDKIV